MRIAMIGIKAIPARFGGFETAVDEISRGLVKRGQEVVVYNRSGMSGRPEKFYEGVKLVTLPTLKSKNFSTIVHAFLSTLHVLFHPVDVVHYYTTGTTLFAPLARLRGMRVVCSVDGADWQRAKWSAAARWYLRLSERMAALFCDGLISDSREVERYYREYYGVSSSCIVYGIREDRSAGTESLTRFDLQPRSYFLFVGRLVPENNVHLLIQAFERMQTGKKLVIVGDDPWQKDYVHALKSTSDSRIVFTGGIYGDGYAQLQQNAYAFVLPDEVGGTHPALVEAMGFGNCVLVNDTASNLEVIGDAGISYQGALGVSDLLEKLQLLDRSSQMVNDYREKAQTRARLKYRWDDVVEKHAHLYRALTSSPDFSVEPRSTSTERS